MKNKTVKFIYFDLGGVIINNRVAVHNVAKRFGILPEHIRQILDQNWSAACRGLLSSQEYMALFKPLNIFHPHDDFVDFWSDHQGIYHETLKLIHELSETFRLGILSNAELGMIEAHMNKKKLPRNTWSAIIESAQHKTIKPEKKIYKIAEKAANVVPEEIFFIDDVPKHIEVAKSLGWQGEVFDTNDISDSIERLKRQLLRSSK